MMRSLILLQAAVDGSVKLTGPSAAATSPTASSPSSSSSSSSSSSPSPPAALSSPPPPPLSSSLILSPSPAASSQAQPPSASSPPPPPLASSLILSPSPAASSQAQPPSASSPPPPPLASSLILSPSPAASSQAQPPSASSPPVPPDSSPPASTPPPLASSPPSSPLASPPPSSTSPPAPALPPSPPPPGGPPPGVVASPPPPGAPPPSAAQSSPSSAPPPAAVPPSPPPPPLAVTPSSSAPPPVVSPPPPPPTTTAPPPAVAFPPPPPPVSSFPPVNAPPPAESKHPPKKSPPKASPPSPPPPATNATSGSSPVPTSSPGSSASAAPSPALSNSTSSPTAALSPISSVVSSPPPGSSSSDSSLPSPSAGTTSTSTTTTTKSSIPTGAVAGIAAGGLLGVVLLVALLICCFCKKPKKGPRGDANGFGPVTTAHSSSATVPLTYAAAGYNIKQNHEHWLVPQDYSTSGMNNGSLAGHSPGAVPPPPQAAGSSPNNMGNNSKSWFTYQELAKATDGFAKENLLGEGGFGRVYKGHLANGTVVAVKQLTVGGGQGEREFRAEVEIISRVHHRHLVSLVGYCVADSQRLLVYDFVPNGTLEYNLHGKETVMDWPTRLKVGLGSARGLAYLHEDCHPRIIHRDIKSSNILLDENFEAQVADFGLAKNSSDAHTHVSTRVMGTFGYLAPEYAASGKLTDKSDVYSFGVVLLELVTGRRPIDTRQSLGNESLVEWARPQMGRVLEEPGTLDDVVDPQLQGYYDRQEMFRMIETAAACVRHSALKRPRMSQVVRALENDQDNAGLYQGMKPGQSMELYESSSSQYGGGSEYEYSGRQSATGGGGNNNSRYNSSGEYDTQQYNAEIRKFKKPSTASGSSSTHAAPPGGSSASELQNSNWELYAGGASAASSGEFDAATAARGDVFSREIPASSQLGSEALWSEDSASNPFATAANRIRSSSQAASFRPPMIQSGSLSNTGSNNNNNNNNNNNRSGFMGGPPPRPAGYYKPQMHNYSGEYVPVGRSVQFADRIDEEEV